MEREIPKVRLESQSFPHDRVQIRKLAGREAISELFRFDLEIVAQDPEDLAEKMTGATATLIFSLTDGTELRKVHGMIAEVSEDLEEGELGVYRLVFVPRAFRLTLIRTQEIFMGLSVPQIIQQKLELVGLRGPDVDLRLFEKYPELEFTVQYKESDLAFISRLTEHLGVSFFFEHDEHREKMVFVDQGHGFHPTEGLEAAPWRRHGGDTDVYSLTADTKLIPLAYMVQDYNYRTPHIDMNASIESQVGFGGGVVEYGAHFKTVEAGVSLAKVRAEEQEAVRRVYTGKSDLCQLAAGATFVLEGNARVTNNKLLVIEATHQMSQPVGLQTGEVLQAYRNTFRAIDASLTYRPARVTPRPRISGVITGVVEQDPQSEIAKYAKMDDQGRYSIKFFFDTVSTAAGRKPSRPVRMVQPHAGPGYGMHFPLKPGVEVVIAFIDGDPDRPLIMGAVPNPETPSPVTGKNALSHQIKTSSGVLFELNDT